MRTPSSEAMDAVRRVVDDSGGYRPAARKLGLPQKSATTLHDILNDKPVSRKRETPILRALGIDDRSIADWPIAELAQATRTRRPYDETRYAEADEWLDAALQDPRLQGKQERTLRALESSPDAAPSAAA